MAKLIQLVGTSGSGKSTIHKQLSERLLQESFRVENIIEPGPLNTLAKSYRLRVDKNPWTETALFTADRMITYTDIVLPRIREEGLIFLSARGFLDTFVYQGLIGGVDLEIIKKMNHAIPSPDLILVFVVDGAVGTQRAFAREKVTGEVLSKNETAEKINLLAAAYRKLPEYFPNEYIKIIDTTSTNEEQVFDVCYDCVKSVI